MMVKDCRRRGEVQRCRNRGTRFKTEVSKFRTVSAVDSFAVAGRKFSKKFKCYCNERKRLVAKDRERKHGDFKSYTFGCGCGTGNFVLQFRKYDNAGEKNGEKKYYVYRVFVKESELEEGLLHFKEIVGNVSERQGNSVTATSFGLGSMNEKVCCKRGGSTKERVREPNDDGFCKREASKVIYSHHHVENFLQVPLLANVRIKSGGRKKLQLIRNGEELTVKSFSKGMLSTEHPICVRDSPKSIGMKVEISGVTGTVGKGSGGKGGKVKGAAVKGISKVANIVGKSTQVIVINVREQQEVDGWTFGALEQYFREENRTIVINQVSFEFSGTPLVNFIKSPQFVREVDWITKTWPAPFQHPRYSNVVQNRTLRRKKENIYFPLIQYYCVTSSAGAYMDFHVDVGGTSFWYHLVCGRKQFLFIEPTEDNIIQYERWACSDVRNVTFFPELVKDKSTVWKMVLKESETLIVPSGWIHAVYTESDSLAFGGNFLNGYSADMQIKIHQLEIRNTVAEKFLCPYFNISNLFAANAFLKKMQLLVAVPEDKDLIFEQELKQIASIVVYIASEYKVVLTSKGKKKAALKKETGTYKTVYDEPRFEDAVKYILREESCATMYEYLAKFVPVMTELFRRRGWK
jgi:hypothetical protein